MKSTTALLALLTVASATELTSVDVVRDKLYLLEAELWKNMTHNDWRDAGLGGDVEITKAAVGFDHQIQSLETPRRLKLEFWIWRKLMEKIQLMDDMYADFMEFSRRQALPGAVPAPVREWNDVAHRVLLDPNKSVVQTVEKLDHILQHFHFEDIKIGHPELCELQMSPQQIVFDAYNAIALAEIKGYAMMQFSWMLLRIYGKGNYTQEANLTRKRYSDRAERTAAAARAALAFTSREMVRCDPPTHVEGETFAEVTKLLQGVIENEVNLNKDFTCKENCAYYSVTKSYGCRDAHCHQLRKCNGRIINCQFIDSDMWTCPAERNSNRRFNWIEYENGQILGQRGLCTLGATKVDSWWRWLFWHCSYCLCICDDPAFDSHRYFSLWDTTADVNNNKVVTGVRLVKLDRVFHLQISEGTLGERGNVSPGSWVPVPSFDPTDEGTVEGQDYHMLSYERRAIDLDDLDSPLGHVLTGVRFRMLGAHLHFEIRSTPFNYTTGRLHPEKSQWISNDNTDGADKPRRKLEMKDPDVPTRMHSAHVLDSEHDQYLEFTNTGVHADVAQTTVPFVDIQNVQPLQGAALLSGAGVAHRGLPGSGGFLTLKVFTYDQARHVNAHPPPDSAPSDVEFVPTIN